MAAAAIGAEFAVVLIVGPVAVAAAATDALHRLQGAAVTVGAGDVDVRAIEPERRLRVVIEQPQVPRHRVVTSRAPVPEVVAVRRLGLFVALAADGLGVGEYLGLMALFAFLVLVLAE